MNKTPVSVLQEMMVKNGKTPNYELIHDGGGTHINTFVYCVTCDGLGATGTGRCKKDAKHEAANAMLTAIAAHKNYPQLPASPANSPTLVPDPVPMSPRLSANVPFINAIGALQDLCTENNLQDPEYIPIGDVGPPHARVFTIRCSVSSFVEDGVGTTKKQAKHEAAKKMIERITNLMAGFNGLYLENKWPKIEEDQTIMLANENAKAQYPLLTKLHPTKKINLGIKLSEYHTVLRDSLDTDLNQKILEGLHNLIPDNFKEPITNELIEDMLNKFSKLMSEINIVFSMRVMDMDTIDSNIRYMRIMQLDNFPPLTQIGIGQTEAEASFAALRHMLDSLKLFLS